MQQLWQLHEQSPVLPTMLVTVLQRRKSCQDSQRYTWLENACSYNIWRCGQKTVSGGVSKACRNVDWPCSAFEGQQAPSTPARCHVTMRTCRLTCDMMVEATTIQFFYARHAMPCGL